MATVKIRSLTWSLTRPARAVWRLLRDVGGAGAGTFVHLGVRVVHLGLRLDQDRAASAIDDVVTEASRRHLDEAEVRRLLRLIRVRIIPPTAGIVPMTAGGHAGPLRTTAWWTGGVRLLERGRVILSMSDDWEERLRAAVLSLLVRELKPNERPPVSTGDNMEVVY